MAEPLFEYLAVRTELAKAKGCKELDAQAQGAVKELSTLLDIFE